MKPTTNSHLRLTRAGRAALRFTLHASRSTALDAFSLIELLITVGLLSLIVLGLLQMFNQTQRAFRTGMSQSDVLENGRAVTDMMQRDIEQMEPSRLLSAVNFFAGFGPRLGNGQSLPPTIFLQNLPGNPSGPVVQRENVFEHFFLLTRENLDWKGIGYVVRTNAAGVGTLYRFESLPVRTGVDTLINVFQSDVLGLCQNNVLSPRLTRVADGVAHLRVTAYDSYGWKLTNQSTNNSNILVGTAPAPAVAGQDFEYFFFNNAVPASVELEIGFLEDRPLARLRSIPDPTAQANYLQDRSAQIHLFRQHIPIRAVDTSVYP